MIQALLLVSLVVSTLPSEDDRFEHTLTLSLSTPSRDWPQAEEEQAFTEWVDHQLRNADAARKANLFVTRGYFLWCRGKHAKGIADLDAALAVMPDNVRGLIFRASMVAPTTRTLEVNPKSIPEPWASEAILADAIRRSSRREYSKALLESIDAHATTNPTLKLHRGLVCLFLKMKVEARASAEEYLKTNQSGPLYFPDMPNFILGTLFLGENNLTKAQEILTEGLALQPDSLYCAPALTIVHCKSGNAEEALEIAKSLLNAYPENYLAHSAMEQALTSLGQWKKAQFYLKRMAERNKDNWRVMSKLSYTYMLEGEFSISAKLLREYADSHPQDQKAETFIFRAAICESYASEFGSDHKRSLRQTLRGGIERDVGSTQDKLLAAGAIANTGEFELAARLLKSLERAPLDPDDASLLVRVKKAISTRTTFSPY